jgi:ribulose-5-phosphate 4-epimerase/fuculose-1-phosphate aldolase
MTEPTEELREKVAVSCRIWQWKVWLTDSGSCQRRIADADEMWIRCRSAAEEGVRYTTVDAIRRVDFDGKGTHKGEPYQVPNELPIHGEIYKKRPDVGCVIHAHPKEALICGITELEFRPIFGAFNITAMRMALEGIPVFPRPI